VQESQANRSSWLLTTLSLTAAPIIYYVVGMQIEYDADPPAMLPMYRIVAMSLAATLLAVGSVIIRRAPRAGVAETPADPRSALAAPERFTVQFLVGAAAVEMSAVLGFVLVAMGAPLGVYIPYGVGTLLAMLAVALPVGLRYWSERERLDTKGPAPIA
jgi:hypothetical protein